MDNSGSVIDVTALTAQVETLSVHSDPLTCRTALFRVLAAESNGMDLSDMVPKILKLLAHPDLVAKKVVYSLLTEYASKQPDIALLAINTLTTECSSANPMVRGLALKTVSSLNHENFIEFGLRAVEDGLNDNSAYVRRIAVNCCARLHHQSPNICHDSGIIDKLYGILRDSDPIVVVNTVVVLEEILNQEGGIVLNKSITHYLLNKMDSLTTWGQIYILNIIPKYKPKSEDEIFDVMNILDAYLTHNSTSVAFSCLKLFLHLIKDHPHLREEVIQRGLKGICCVLGSDNPELVYCVIEIVEKFLNDGKSMLESNYKQFFCKQKEPPFVKCKKINLLPYLVEEKNGKDILDELTLYTTDSSKPVSLAAIAAMGTVLEIQPLAVQHCFRKFKRLLESDVEYIFSNTLQVLQKLDIRGICNYKELIMLVSSKMYSLTDDPGKCAFLSILGCHGDVVEDSPYIIEDFIETFEEDWSEEVQLNLLTAVVRLFFHFPAACQGILGQVMEMCFSSPDKVLKDQAVFYYTLLHTDIHKAKAILLHDTVKS